MFCSLEIQLNLYFVFAYLSFTVKCCWHFCDNGSQPRGHCVNRRALFFVFAISSGHPNVKCAVFCLFFSPPPFIHLLSMPLRLSDSSVVQCSFNSLLASWLTVKRVGIGSSISIFRPSTSSSPPTFPLRSSFHNERNMRLYIDHQRCGIVQQWECIFENKFEKKEYKITTDGRV